MATGTWGSGSSTQIFRVTVKFERATVKCMTGFHLRDVGIAGQTAEEVVNAVDPWVSTHFINTLKAEDHVIALDAVNIATAEGHEKAYTTLMGVQPGEGAPTFITVPVSLKSAQRRRYGQGRMLWPVSSEAAMFGNVLNPGTVPQYQAAIDNLLSRFTGPAITTDLQLVNVHGALPARGTRPAIPASWYDVTSARLNTALGSLRRRKVGVGQ